MALVPRNCSTVPSLGVTEVPVGEDSRERTICYNTLEVIEKDGNAGHLFASELTLKWKLLKPLRTAE
jgi:hypothetical protein